MTMTHNVSPYVANEDLTLDDVVNMLRQRAGLIVKFILFGLIAATAFVLLVTPKFTAETTLKFNPTSFEIDGRKPSIGSDLFDRLIEGEIAAIRSPAVLLKVINSQQLLNDPELNRTSVLELPGMVANTLIDAITGKRRGPASQDLKILAKFQKNLAVTNPTASNLISISYSSESAEKSAGIANAIASTFLAQHLEDRLSDTPVAAKWLNERSEGLRNRWRTSEDRVEKFKAEHGLSYVGDDKLRENQVNRINEQLVLAGAKTEETRARLEQARKLMKARNFQQLAIVAKSEVFTRLRDRLAAASQREASLATNLLPSHPTLKQARAQITSLQADIVKEGQRLLNNLELESKTAKEREALLRTNFDKTIREMQDSSSALVKLRELERTAATDRDIYEAFLNRSNETQEQKTGALANFQLIKKAQTPIKPSFPSRMRVLLISLAGSLVAGIGFAFLLESQGVTRARRESGTIKTSVSPNTLQLKEATLLGVLPTLTGSDLADPLLKKTPELVVSASPNTRYASAIASLGRAIASLGPRRNYPRVILVTSPMEHEGNTMVAASLAQDAAARGERVLLIDANWQHPRLHKIFRQAAPCHGDAPSHKDSPVFSHDQTGIDILPALETAEAWPRFVRSREFSDILSSARKTYDLVIIDGGSILSGPDMSTISGTSDATILVSDSTHESSETVQRALAHLQQGHAGSVGLVLRESTPPNFVRERRYDPAPEFGAHRSSEREVSHSGNRA